MKCIGCGHKATQKMMGEPLCKSCGAKLAEHASYKPGPELRADGPANYDPAIHQFRMKRWPFPF